MDTCIGKPIYDEVLKSLRQEMVYSEAFKVLKEMFDSAFHCLLLKKASLYGKLLNICVSIEFFFFCVCVCELHN